MGNTHWEEEEDRKLLTLYTDVKEQDKKIKLIDVAKKADKYGMFPNRTVGAIKERLRGLLSPIPAGEDKNDEQLEFNLYKGKYEKLKATVDTFLDGVFKGLEKYPNGAPKWSYGSVTSSIEASFPERLAAELDNIKE